MQAELYIRKRKYSVLVFYILTTKFIRLWNGLSGKAVKIQIFDIFKIGLANV